MFPGENGYRYEEEDEGLGIIPLVIGAVASIASSFLPSIMGSGPNLSRQAREQAAGEISQIQAAQAQAISQVESQAAQVQAQIDATHRQLAKGLLERYGFAWKGRVSTAQLLKIGQNYDKVFKLANKIPKLASAVSNLSQDMAKFPDDKNVKKKLKEAQVAFEAGKKNITNAANTVVKVLTNVHFDPAPIAAEMSQAMSGKGELLPSIQSGPTPKLGAKEAGFGGNLPMILLIGGAAFFFMRGKGKGKRR
jgi:outer membrane murein-binding lipoprotein Lpp